MDTIIFSRYRVYLAAPLFSEAERTYNAFIAELLKKNLFEVYLPQEAGDDSAGRDRNIQKNLFRRNITAIEESDIVVAIIDGADSDSGTSWEMGYAYSLRKIVIALRTDFRHVGAAERVNLMLEQSAAVVTTPEKLLEAINAPLQLKSDQ
jgi:nucleoside 2-deoxyribosyltransferase